MNGRKYTDMLKLRKLKPLWNRNPGFFPEGRVELAQLEREAREFIECALVAPRSVFDRLQVKA